MRRAAARYGRERVTAAVARADESGPRRGHPRGAGSFCRMLAEHVGLGRGRTPPAKPPPTADSAAPTDASFERVPLVRALAKMSLLPARRLQRVCAAFARKGRLQVRRSSHLCRCRTGS